MTIQNLNQIPMVIESSGRGERAYDIYSRLLKERVVFHGWASRRLHCKCGCRPATISWNLRIQTKIFIYILILQGVQLLLGLAIYDTMQFIKPDISTLCIGQAASMGALLLTAGTKGKRFALPHARCMIHQPLGGFSGQASDIDIHAQEILKVRDNLNSILKDHTGQSLKNIQKDTDRDNFMSATESAKYGLIDKVINKR